ncbi:MAG TPA: hypothetical protein VEK57_29580 [Thermoanaerobaculia bacterium]|nr:hypothetical protein [Thermoanaerobaculia bacterium]
MATQAEIQVIGTTLGVPAELNIHFGGGPLSIRLAPKEGINFNAVWDEISNQLQQFLGFGLPSLNGPWAKALLGLSDDGGPLIVTPTLWISPSGASKTYSVSLQLEFSKILTIGGSWQVGPITIEMEPTYRIEALIFAYDSAAGGLTIKAKVVNKTTSVPTSPNQVRLLGAGAPAGEKSQILTFPFPVPAQQPPAGKLFVFHYIGIGQRVGPNPNVSSDDPMLAIFEQLETQLTGDDPAEVLTTLANNFYHPDRGWFIGLDVEMRGFRIMLLFNDPAMYGLRISVGYEPLTPFSGFLFEILYQKLSPNLGVYYGALTLPYFMRRIVLQGVILILPGFAIWIYTNGDFRINVGWPLGDNSIAVQVGPLVGAGGFYFAKLRSADNPGVQPTVDYNPILAFGIGLMLYIKQGFNSSIFSAQIDVSVTVTLQGLLAWKAGAGTFITRLPDHYWFAGTASLSVLIQGSVDFAIIKASVTISFQAFAGLALETGYGTLIQVSASVSVRVSVKVIFFTIHFSFSTSVSTQFTITGGTPASVNGPLDPDLQGIIHPSLQELMREQVEAHIRSTITRLTPKVTSASRLQMAALSVFSPQVIEVQFALQPTVVYTSGGSGAFSVIASLFVEAPAPGSTPTLSTPFEQLIISTVDWLLSLTLPGPELSARFQQIVTMLGAGSAAPMGDWVTWRTQLDAFLGALTFAISEVDTTSNDSQTAAVLPMLDVLRLTYTDQDGVVQNVDFDTYTPVGNNYPSLINEYYQNVGWVGENPQTQADAMRDSVNVRDSFASYILADYFLMQSRNAANALLTAAQAYEKEHHQALVEDMTRMVGDPARVFELMACTTEYVAQVTGTDELEAILSTFDYVSAAGMGSRYILNGLQLPVPDSPSFTEPMNVLTGQQYGVAPGARSASGTLSISPTSGARPGSIVFDSGSPGSATCTLALPPLPPMPSPEWQGATGSPYNPVNGTIDLAALPGVTPGPLYYSTRNQVSWDAAGLPRTILPLPQPLQSLVAAAPAPLQMTVLTTPPPTSNDPSASSPQGPPLPATGALLIRLSISQVPSNSAIDIAPGSPSAGASGSPGTGTATQFLPYVYAVSGTDEATRDLIFNALQGDLLSNASISLLYTTTARSSPSSRPPVASPTGPSGLESDDLSESVLLAKTNLSTLNQAPGAGAAQAARFELVVKLGDDAAAIGDVKGFLRLLWEVSVVNAPGFFLYYITASGEDLPPLFGQPGTPGGNPAQFDILVQFAPEPSNLVPLTNATNCVFLDEGAPGGAVYLEILQQTGAPVLQYAPTYAAGSIGFSLLWHRPEKTNMPVPVNDLYTLVQYQIAGGDGYTESVWSLPVGPSENNGPQAALASPSDWSYVTTVAASFFHGSPAGNRYSIIDQEVDLGFRIVDLYGDVLPGAVEASFLPLYQDPLLTIAQWPGVIWSWAVVAGGNSAATLVLTVTFDPSSVIPPPASPDTGGETASQQWLGILSRYGLILDQLTDPNTMLSLTSSLTGGAMVDRATITEKLVTLASAIARNIGDAIGSSPIDVEGLVETIEVPIPFSAVVALTNDIIHVNFAVGAARDPALVDPTAVAKMPSAVSVSYGIPPQLETSSSPSSSPALRFAIDFESAFSGFEGAGSTLKLAQRAGVQDGDDAPSVESFWAVRWGRAAGLAVEFEPEPVFYALAPLSNAPVSGVFGGRTWTNVDVDVWARQFLAAYDNFLAPQMAVAVAVLDVANGTNWFDRLAKTKENLAGTIVKGVQALFDHQPEGSRAAAQSRLQQALLSTLSNAFTVSTIVQVSAAVTMNGTPSPITSPARAPRLYGSVGPMSTDSPLDARQYTLTPGELDLIPGQNWMTTLLTVTNGSNVSSITLPLAYQVSYLQHDFEVGEAFLDYIPSSWLKFTLPQGEPLQMSIAGETILPVPLIFIPQSPSLMGQAAGASPLGSGGNPNDIGQEIAAALRWTYDVGIAPNWQPQDALFFDLTYNETPNEIAARSGFDAFFVANLNSLADALATFLMWYEANSGSFSAIVREAFPGMPGSPSGSPGTAAALVETFATLAAAVQAAWDGLFEVSADALLVPQVTIDSFFTSTAPDGTRQLFGSAQDGSNPLYWPTINGQVYNGKTATQSSPGAWWEQRVTFPAAALLNIAIPDIEIAQRQSATTDAWIVRNANLIQGRTTNADFVYNTDPVAFSTAVVPLIHRATLATLQPAKEGLITTLVEVLAPIANTGAGLSTHLRLAASYSFSVAFFKTEALPASEAVLLADALEIGGSPVHVTEVATLLAAGISAWYLAAPRPQAGALLNLALTLFGTLGSQQLPLVQIDQIPIDVSAVDSQWWST